MKTIKEITYQLFSVDFEKDLDTDSVIETYENRAEELIKNNNWSEVYACWYDYLLNKCKTEEEILNFANLFWLYEGYKQIIPNPVEFCSFFYACVSFEHYPDAVDILDSITFEVFQKSVYPNKTLYYDEYIPTNDPLVIEAINKWKEKGYGLRSDDKKTNQ